MCRAGYQPGGHAGLHYTSTDVQGELRRFLRSDFRLDGPWRLKWQTLTAALRSAAIALHETPPDEMYHGLNGVHVPPTDPDDDTGFHYLNFISLSMSLKVAQTFALGIAGTVSKPSTRGTVLFVDMRSDSQAEDYAVADVRWISKFPDEQEWLCPQCCDSELWVVAEVRGKKNKSIKGNSRIHYLCHWQGYGTDDDTYEPLENIPKESRVMINEYNKRLREEQGSQGGSKKAKR